MGSGRERRGEARQTKAMLAVLGVRVREAEGRLADARAALVEAERRHEVCRRDVEVEDVRMRSIIESLRSPEVSGSAARYTEVLAVRDVVARDLWRERLMFEDAGTKRDWARAALAERRDELVRLRARTDALRERLAELVRRRDDGRELVAEGEAEELAAMRHARSGGALL